MSHPRRTIITIFSASFVSDKDHPPVDKDKVRRSVAKTRNALVQAPSHRLLRGEVSLLQTRENLLLIACPRPFQCHIIIRWSDECIEPLVALMTSYLASGVAIGTSVDGDLLIIAIDAKHPFDQQLHGTDKLGIPQTIIQR